MSAQAKQLLSVVVPVFNEAGGLPAFHRSLLAELQKLPGLSYEIIYCNDGSQDESLRLLHKLAADNQRVRVLSLTRNFGKEMATTAGLQTAKGDAVMTIDADGQHPAELIPSFVELWRQGHKVVVGLRATNEAAGRLKRSGSWLFYRFFGRLLGMNLTAGVTDFRLIDKTVQQQFIRMTERNRITRGLIDWLGYTPAHITFHAKPRAHGEAAYSVGKLFKLAIDSAISLSTSPLYISAYIGAVILPLAVLLAAVMVGNGLLGDPLDWQTTGTAYLSVLMLFLVGVLLLSQGIIGLYLSRIHQEAQNRPLYVIDPAASVRP